MNNENLELIINIMLIIVANNLILIYGSILINKIIKYFKEKKSKKSKGEK